MTLKHQEVMAQKRVREFLEALVIGDYKRTPKIVREEALRRLRHLASECTVERGSIQG